MNTVHLTAMLICTAGVVLSLVSLGISVCEIWKHYAASGEFVFPAVMLVYSVVVLIGFVWCIYDVLADAEG
ncbi:MAG: hypothetical protein AABY11_00660 [archaeon]